jgi:hypothetical protein
MSATILRIISMFPLVGKYFNLVKWLLAESGYQKKVALWLAAENAWYFKLAAGAWGILTITPPVTPAVLQAALTAKTQ